MNATGQNILTVPRLPARLDVPQVAVLLGFRDFEIPVLIRAKLLEPLGEPAQNGHKYFAASEIELLSSDRTWLDKATKILSRHWQSKRAALHRNRLTHVSIKHTGEL